MSFGDEILEFEFVLEESVLLDLFLAFQFLPVLPQLLQLRLLPAALGRGLFLCVLRHCQLIFQGFLHVLCRLALAANGVVFFLELGCLSA